MSCRNLRARAWDASLINVNFIQHVADNLLQMRVMEASQELARFGINTTLGSAGLFDVADSWFDSRSIRTTSA